MSETLKNPLAEVNFHIIAWSTPHSPIFFFLAMFSSYVWIMNMVYMKVHVLSVWKLKKIIYMKKKKLCGILKEFYNCYMTFKNLFCWKLASDFSNTTTWMPIIKMIYLYFIWFISMLPEKSVTWLDAPVKTWTLKIVVSWLVILNKNRTLPFLGLVNSEDVTLECPPYLSTTLLEAG